MWCVVAFLFINSIYIFLDSKKDLKRLRRVEPRSRDQFEVPEVPVEWMSKYM
jgi:hypothetical protein